MSGGLAFPQRGHTNPSGQRSFSRYSRHAVSSAEGALPSWWRRCGRATNRSGVTLARKTADSAFAELGVPARRGGGCGRATNTADSAPRDGLRVVSGCADAEQPQRAGSTPCATTLYPPAEQRSTLASNSPSSKWGRTCGRDSGRTRSSAPGRLSMWCRSAHPPRRRPFAPCPAGQGDEPSCGWGGLVLIFV